MMDQGEGIGNSSHMAENEPSLGKTWLEISAVNVVPSRDHVKMTDFKVIGSYNWLNSKIPTILVPGICPLLSLMVAARQSCHLY